ncbi:hypothetical protein HMPREF0880_04135 [Yokenella regensburgei ATCC 43003]|nr:hypothetical protein HMPREF0880_04135 [Yokenella regensburgei ATCC 43003]
MRKPQQVAKFKRCGQLIIAQRVVAIKDRRLIDKFIRHAIHRQRAAFIDKHGPFRLTALVFKVIFRIAQHFKPERDFYCRTHSVTKKEQTIDVELELGIHLMGNVFEVITLAGDVGIFQYNDLAPGEQRGTE